MSIQIFVQSELLNDIEVIKLKQGSSLEDARKSCLELMPSIDCSENFNFYIEDDDDEQSIEKLKTIPNGLRIHLHRLKGICIHVNYAGREIQRTFRPGSTIARVKKWTIREFNICKSDAAELMLQISGTGKRPDADIHIGSLVQYPNKSICFDLVPSPRING